VFLTYCIVLWGVLKWLWDFLRFFGVLYCVYACCDVFQGVVAC